VRNVILITLILGFCFSLSGAPTVAGQSTGAQPSADVAEADRLSAQVVKLYQEGKIEEATPLAKRALKLRERVLGPRHREVANAKANLAILYVAANKYGDAEQQLKQALAIYEKDPTDDLATAKTLESLGSILTLKREYPKAEEFYRRAISIKENKLGVKHPEFLASLNQLADLFLRQKDFKQAEPVLQRAANTTSDQLGETSREFGKALQRLACAQYKNNEQAEAEKTDTLANHLLYAEAAKKADPIVLEDAAFRCRLISDTHPDFASVALAKRYQGSTSVMVAVEADETGAVISARFVGGDPIFKSAAESAALHAKLRPLVVDGKPMKVNGLIVHQYAVMTMTMTRTVAVPVRVGGP
jgi:tetratricopeptide (TPR) repeat protein